MRGTVTIDSVLIKNAVEKAKELNISTSMGNLLRHLLSELDQGVFEVSRDDLKGWNFERTTQVLFDPKLMHKAKQKLKKLGVKGTSSFVINMLFKSFLDREYADQF